MLSLIFCIWLICGVFMHLFNEFYDKDLLSNGSNDEFVVCVILVYVLGPIGVLIRFYLGLKELLSER